MCSSSSPGSSSFRTTPEHAPNPSGDLGDVDLTKDPITNSLDTLRQQFVGALTLKDVHWILQVRRQDPAIGQVQSDLCIERFLPDGRDVPPVTRLGHLHPVIRDICNGRAHPIGWNLDRRLLRWYVSYRESDRAVGCRHVTEHDDEVDGIFANQ